MRVRWQEIEPQFAGRVRTRLRMMTPAPERLSPAWMVFAWIVSVLFLAAYVGICFHAAGAAALVGLAFMPMALMGIALAPAYITARRAPHAPCHALPRHIPPAVFEKAVRAAPTSVAEVLYGEILVLLHTSDVSPDERRLLLRQCTALLKRYRHLAQLIQHQNALHSPQKSSAFTTGNCLSAGGRWPLGWGQSAPDPQEVIPIFEEMQQQVCDALDAAWQVLAHKKMSVTLLQDSERADIDALMRTLRPIAEREQAHIAGRAS